jgi:putative ABC transport system permease protein
MQLLNEIKRTVATWLRRETFDQEMQDEMRLHLELREEEYVERGIPPEGARSAAHRRFGNATRMREKSREAWGWIWLEQFLQDVRYGWRTMRRNPGFTAVAVIALALGIGANAAVFSVVNAVLLQPLAYEDPDRLVAILHRGYNPVSPANFFDWQKQNHVFERLGAAESTTPNLTGGDHPEHIPGVRLTYDILPMLGVQPGLGRFFLPEEENEGQDRVVILSYGVWQRRFSGDRDVIGRTVSLNGEPHVIVGVMPKGFKFAPFWATTAQLWMPLSLGARANDRGGNSLRIFGRLKPNTTLKEARAEMETITGRLEQQFPGSNRNVTVVPLKEKVVGAIRRALLVLLGAVGFVLLIACANVAHMQLARAAARQKEMALRSALGARRNRIVRQLLTESVLLAVAGGTLGVLLAKLSIKLLIALGPQIPRLDTVTLDHTVLLFTAAVSILTGAAFGLAPAAQAARWNVNQALKESGRALAGTHAGGRLRGLLVASEFALALVLLIGAGLMIRSFLALQTVDPGLNPHNLLTMIISVAGSKEAEAPRRAAFFQEVVSRVKALPGVENASAINHLPLAGDEWGLPFYIEGRPRPKQGESDTATYRVILPAYFRTMQMSLIRGRDLTEADGAAAPSVVVINEYMARRHWPGEEALGRRITLDNPENHPQWLTIIGVVKNAVRSVWTAPPEEEVFLPYMQSRDYTQAVSPHYEYMTLVARISHDPAALTASVKGAIWSLDGNVPVAEVQTMDEAVSASTAEPRFYLILLSSFAAVALVLAGIGIYGVMSYMVSRRTQEIGIRMTLGARPGEVLRMVIRQGMVLALIGAALGVISALLLSRLMSSLLYGVGSHDPTTFVVVTLVLMLVSLAANYVPARRATKIDPMLALRSD